MQGYIEKLKDNHNEEDTISISQIGSVHAQLRKNKWYSSQNIFILTPNDKSLINLFVVTTINKVLTKYGGYSSYPTLQILKNHEIQLPFLNGKINFSYMEKFIEELEAYLIASGLKDYHLTKEEQKALDEFYNIDYTDEKLIRVFNVKNTKNILFSEITPNSGSFPYLSASSTNNGVASYINYKEELKDKGNCIFIGGKTFVVSYQESDFFSNDSHNLALYLQEENKVNKTNQLFLATCIKKSLEHKYSWGDSISNQKIQKDNIVIPVKNKNIDYDFMEKFIKAIQKLIIKDVVVWADKKIEATKKVISKNN